MNDFHMPMKTILPYFVVLIFFFSASCQNSQTLFQENEMDWFVMGDANWKFDNDELIGQVKDGSGFVMTEKVYADFLLELEFKPDSTINSGVFLRCQNKDISPTDCYEANIWDLHPNQDFRTGAIVTKAPPMNQAETINKWNTLKINIEKDHMQLWINGLLIADLIDGTLPKGFIGLQATGIGEIRFRNIKIKAIN